MFLAYALLCASNADTTETFDVYEMSQTLCVWRQSSSLLDGTLSSVKRMRHHETSH